LFKLMPDHTEDRGKHRGYIEAAHAWRLPNIECPDCHEIWGIIGVEYPCSEPPGGLSRKYRPRVSTLDEFKCLRDSLAPRLPPGVPAPPGTEFGPLIGRIRGSILSDLNWLRPWTLLIRRRVLRLLEKQGVVVSCNSVPQLGARSEADDGFVEIQIEPLASLIEGSFIGDRASVCATCGRDNRRLRQPIVQGSSLPMPVDLVRAKNFPTLIIATERFVAAVEELQLENLLFEELETRLAGS